jgi:hypothetical protein
MKKRNALTGMLIGGALLILLSGCLKTAAQPVATPIPGLDNLAPEASAEPWSTPVPPPTATAPPDDGMVSYINVDYGYQLRVPPTAEVTAIGVQSFPNAELPAGMTPGEYMVQLSQQYPEGLCVQIIYRAGYIYISVPANREYRYATCGRTGVGAGEMMAKSEELAVAGAPQTAKGFEYIAPGGVGSGLAGHNETMVLNLADGTRIEYGARPDAATTFEDYRAEIRPVLLQIVGSYAAWSAR